MSLPFINPIEILQQRAQEDPDRLCHLILGAKEEENQSHTYSQTDRAVKELAAYLQHVAEPGERALIVHPTGLEFITSMYACMYAGIVPIPTNPPGMNRSAQRLDAIARDARATLVLTTPEYQKTFLDSADQFPEFAALKWVTRGKRTLVAGEGRQTGRYRLHPIYLRLHQHSKGRDHQLSEFFAQHERAARHAAQRIFTR
jgi:acyl-CoA synthetase (AMP-forming)/AMP-acid ligase II